MCKPWCKQWCKQWCKPSCKPWCPPQLREEWRFAAMVVDRAFLWAFAALTGGTALGTALDAALHRPPTRPFP